MSRCLEDIPQVLIVNSVKSFPLIAQLNEEQNSDECSVDQPKSCLLLRYFNIYGSINPLEEDSAEDLACHEMKRRVMPSRLSKLLWSLFFMSLSMRPLLQSQLSSTLTNRLPLITLL